MENKQAILVYLADALGRTEQYRDLIELQYDDSKADDEKVIWRKPSGISRNG